MDTYLSIAFECLVSLKSFEQFLTSIRSVTICLNPIYEHFGSRLVENSQSRKNDPHKVMLINCVAMVTYVF